MNQPLPADKLDMHENMPLIRIGVKYHLMLCAVVFFIVLALLTTPILPQAFPLGLGRTVHDSAGATEKSISYWMPPLVSTGAFLAFEGNGIETIAWSRYGSPIELSAEGELMGKLVACPSLPLYGRYTVRLRPGGWFKVTLLGGHDALRLFLFLAGWLVAILYPLRIRGTDRRLSWLLIGAVSLRFLYAGLVPWGTNSVDAEGHLFYVKLLSQGKIPASGDCWQCYHSPISYAFPALVHHATSIVGIPSEDLLRLFSLLFSCIFLFLGADLVGRFLGNSPRRLLGIALFSFWPAAIWGAPVFNNDVPMHVFGIASLWFLESWRQRSRLLTLWGALICAGIAGCIKTNGFLYLGIVSVAVIAWYTWKCSSLRDSMRHLGNVVLVIVLVGSAYIAVQKLRISLHQGDFLVGNIALQRSHSVEYARDLRDFLPFPSQVRAFFTLDPDVLNANDFSRGFWTNFLRSNIAMSISSPMLLAIFVCLLSALIPFLAILAIQGCRNVQKDRLYLCLCFLVFLLAAMIFRWMYPFACSANVRYVLGMILPFVILVVRGMENLTGWKIQFATAVVLSFIGLSAWLYVTYSVLWM